MFDKKICVVGVGYVGLPCALMLAKAGCQVVGFDVDHDKVGQLNSGQACLEQGLQEIYMQEDVRRRFRVSTSMEQADVFIIAVPTPIDGIRKTADLSVLKAAVEEVAQVVEQGNLVIVESTVPPLTMRNLVIPILQTAGIDAQSDIFLAHCPERLLPGNVLYEIIHNNRVIGGYTRESAVRAEEIYKLFVEGTIALTDDVTAEMCKLMENTYRDVNIALVNELSEVCRAVGISAAEAIELANLHPRVNLLKPGIGVGGHCLPVDPWFIHEAAPYNSTIINAARHINDARPQKVAEQIRQYVSDDISQKFLLLGKTYKEETTEIRESPALKIYETLQKEGYNVCAYDSEVDKDADMYELMKECSYIFVLVRHTKMMEQLKAGLDRYENIKVIYF